MQPLVVLHPAHGKDYFTAEACKDAFYRGLEFRTQKERVLTTKNELPKGTKVLLKFNNLQRATDLIV